MERELYALLYVSRCLIGADQQPAELAAITRVSKARNAAAVTGALLCTGDRFAQILEGQAAAVGEIMASIVRDRRHTEVTIIEVEEALAAHRFDDWTLAYAGPSSFAATTVARALAERDRGDRAAVRSLIRLLQELARPPFGQPAG